MIEERSAGAVVYYGEDTVEYLLLHYPAGHWDFPKGNIEKGEDDLATVRREVQEETGIKTITLQDGFKHVIEYNYRKKNKPVHKKVVFYLARSDTKQVQISSEHHGYIWLPIDKAMRKVTFNNARKVLSAADKFLRSMESK